MGGDSDDESRTTVSADQLLSMGSCSVQEIDHVRLVVAWGNAFAVSTDGLSKMLEKGLELASALQQTHKLKVSKFIYGSTVYVGGLSAEDRASALALRRTVIDWPCTHHGFDSRCCVVFCCNFFLLKILGYRERVLHGTFFLDGSDPSRTRTRLGRRVLRTS